MSDRMNDTLTALRSDTERVPLSSSASVRRRGNQRTRRQAIGASLAAVAVVAAAVGISGQLLGGSNEAVPPPIATQPAPSPALHSLAGDPFLPAEGIQVGPYETFQRSPEAVDDSIRPLQCLSSPTTWGAAETQSQLYYSDLDATFVEHVLRYDSEATATTAAGTAAEDFAACPKGDPTEATVADRAAETLAVSSAAYRLSRVTTPKADSEISYVEVGVVRDGNVVVVLEWTSMGNPEGDTGWVWSSDRLTQAIEQAVSE
jgi:hypothetical protein